MKKNLIKRMYIPSSLYEGASVELNTLQTHYVRNVIRQKEKDNLLLFNENDGEWLAEISVLSKKYCSCLISQQKRPTYHEPELILAFALVKGNNCEHILQKATELGVTRIQPLVTERTVVKKVNYDKWSIYVAEAAEQCERLTVPVIEPLMNFEDFVDDDMPYTWWCDETGTGQSLSSANEPDIKRPSCVLVGPEGGFSEQEIEALKSCLRVIAISLGPRILRADTACYAILSNWQARYGDWQDKHPDFRFEDTL